MASTFVRDYSSSKLHPFVQLSSLPEAICGTEPRLVLPHPVTLRLQSGRPLFPVLLGSSNKENRFKITCADTGALYFQCQEKFSGKRILWDVAGTPVLNFKRIFSSWPFPSPPTWKVSSGNKSSSPDGGKPLLRLKVKEGLFGKGRVTADFPDVCSGRLRRIVLKWNDWKNMAVVYSGEPKQDGVTRIAKLYKSPYSKSHFLHISPEVDVALIATMCLVAIDK